MSRPFPCVGLCVGLCVQDALLATLYPPWHSRRTWLALRAVASGRRRMRGVGNPVGV